MAAKSNTNKKATKKKTTAKSKQSTQDVSFIKDEILIFIMLAACVFLLISNFGYGGLIGDVISGVLFGLFGWIAYIMPVFIFGAVAFLISNKGNTAAYIKAVSAILFV